MISGLANDAANKAKGRRTCQGVRQLPFGRNTEVHRRPGCTRRCHLRSACRAALGTATRVASLQLGCEDSRMVGNCDTGSSCAYTNTLSWKDPDTPLPVEVNPRSVFERLFGTVDPSLPEDVRSSTCDVPQEHSGSDA